MCNTQKFFVIVHEYMAIAPAQLNKNMLIFKPNVCLDNWPHLSIISIICNICDNNIIGFQVKWVSVNQENKFNVLNMMTTLNIQLAWRGRVFLTASLLQLFLFCLGSYDHITTLTYNLRNIATVSVCIHYPESFSHLPVKEHIILQ